MDQFFKYLFLRDDSFEDEATRPNRQRRIIDSDDESGMVTRIDIGHNAYILPGKGLPSGRWENYGTRFENKDTGEVIIGRLIENEATEVTPLTLSKGRHPRGRET